MVLKRDRQVTSEILDDEITGIVTQLVFQPGAMLVEEFLKPMKLTQYRLAKEIGVSQRRIGEIVTGKRGISADTDLRLCRFFGLSDGWWLRLQVNFDIQMAKGALAKTLSKIKPWSGSKRAA